MVTAIVIPIIFFYFFWKTKKEMKEQDQKWLSIGNVRQEAILTGQIKEITIEKQHYYDNRYIYVQEIKLQSFVKLIKAKKVTPLTKNVQTAQFTVGETVRVFGRWEGSQFFFNHFEVLYPTDAKR